MSFGIDSFTSEIGPFPDRRILDAGGKGPITRDPDAVAAPLIDIGDLKPGDFGEVTFSLHLCDNPGYIWANTMNVAWDENGVTEPEGADDDEAGPADEAGSTTAGDSLDGAQVELLDTVQASVFYDGGNNLFDSAQENPSCIGFVLDDSGSMGETKAEQTRNGAKAVVNELDIDDDGDIDPHQAAVATFGSGSDLQQGLTNDVGDLETAIDEVDGDSGTTNMAAGIREAAGELAECEQDNKVLIVLSNGAENIGNARDAADDTVADGAVDTFFTIGVQAGASGDQLLQDIAAKSPSGQGVFLDVTDPAQITAAFGQLVQILGGDTEIISGSLRDVLGEMLAEPETGDWGLPLDAAVQAEGRQPFINSNTAHIGFEWWVPVDHGNEIQSDMVEFDLSFYTEQARHNDGAGLPMDVDGNESNGNESDENGTESLVG
ncbi:von Willebrand factor type A [Halodesulfurarchaeum formicicum]|uniref:von Willebrand factor type A n=1 Tax=Halodesulfurarchaeum formicicum TaxID=1873524 RepID=A0A1D8S410_9EURY|nr:vWA domain-containing protein [Halodesulfurarchaeum formicicum]AOW80088.1 von Willebrand factor type A [Halodesulfurarchaeum formicicum]